MRANAPGDPYALFVIPGSFVQPAPNLTPRRSDMLLRWPMPPKHRPTPPIPQSWEFLTRTLWFPVLLFWMLVMAASYAVWLLK